MENEDDEKTEEPSQYKLEEFRNKGIVASSKEINNLFILVGCFLTIIFSSVYLFETLETFIRWIFDLYYENAYNDKNIKILLSEVGLTIFKCVIPVFSVSVALGIILQVSQIGFIFSFEAISAKWERIDPIQGIKRIFSLKAVYELFKSLLKFIIIVFISYLVLKTEFKKFPGLLQINFLQSFEYSKELLIKLGGYIFLGLFFLAAMDLFWEKFNFRKKLQQTKQEQKEELKQREGSPEIRQKIRSLQRQMVQKRMMNNVPKADVIITNPTHYSVAIKYQAEKMLAPVVVAKGKDHLALRIRQIATKNNVPMVENVPLARSLYSTVKVGEAIPRSLYKAVAEILAFVFKLKKKQKALQV